MVPGKPEDQNSYLGELGGKIGVMCTLQIIDSVMGSTPLMVDICDNISALIRASIHPESVKLLWKQADLISRLSDVYNSINPHMLLVHVYGHHNSGKPAPTLTTVAYLNVRLEALAEFIMALLLSFPAPRPQ